MAPRLITTPQQLIQQGLGAAEAEGKVAAQQPHQGTEAGPVWAGLHLRRQFGASAGATAGADQPVQMVFNHQRRDWRDLDHLMAQRLRVVNLQMGAAAAALLRMVLLHIITALRREQLRSCAGMALLPATFAATGLSAGRCGLNPAPLLEGGLEELRVLRPRRSSSSLMRTAWSASCCRSCSSSYCRTWSWPTMSLTLSCQSAAEIPAGGVLISGALSLRCKHESCRRQGVSGGRVRAEPSRPPEQEPFQCIKNCMA
jgi:hypothetical protein